MTDDQHEDNRQHRDVRRIARPRRPIDPTAPDATTADATGPPELHPPLTRNTPASAPPNAPAASETDTVPASQILPGRFPNMVRVTRRVDVNLEQLALAEQRRSANRNKGWLYGNEEVAQHQARPWYQVICLTGVDYFSTLGYQPGIAYLAAGLLSPVATFILVAFTLLGALPTYSRVAAESPHGQGSIAMLERLLPRWKGKLFVLCLLGFAATDFVITITLSAADATAHVTENPLVPDVLNHNVAADIGITLLLIGVLGAIFLRGFKEAIGIAVALVVVYLVLNLIVISRALVEVGAHPHLFVDWKEALIVKHGNPFAMVGVALLLFPKLALGLSGFETGVAVMPLVKGDPNDTEQDPRGRINNTRKLLATAAILMSVYLITSSLVTTLLIPPDAFEPGGAANGRALAFLAHEQLGNVFGTFYDLSTIAILWFAGASAMAGLLNLVPRYLPGYGMAPKWAAAQRPLVIVFTAIAFLVTLVFEADVDKQGSAYATGVLVLMASASVAVALSARRRHSRWAWAFIAISLAFFYITVQNVHERPSGLVIASIFIVSIVLTSIISRVLRSTEIRVEKVIIDRRADRIIREAIHNDIVRLIMHKPSETDDVEEYERYIEETRRRHNIPHGEPVLVVEVRADDPSVFADELVVSGYTIGPHQVLRCAGPAIPNSIAALALAIHGQYHCRVHLNMRWTPIPSFAAALGRGFQFVLWGTGDTARLVEMEIRQEVPDDTDIIVHVA